MIFTLIYPMRLNICQLEIITIFLLFFFSWQWVILFENTIWAFVRSCGRFVYAVKYLSDRNHRAMFFFFNWQWVVLFENTIWAVVRSYGRFFFLFWICEYIYFWVVHNGYIYFLSCAQWFVFVNPYFKMTSS